MSLAGQVQVPESSEFEVAHPISQSYAKVRRISAHNFTALLILLDVTVLILAGTAPAILRAHVELAALGQLLTVVSSALLLFLLTARALGTYDTAHNFEWTRVIPTAISSLLLTFFVLMVIGIATKTAEDYSRVWFFSWISLSLVLIVSLRAVLLVVVEAKLAKGACLQRALIITCGESTLTGDQLALETKNRVRAVGTIATHELSSVPDLGPYLRQLSPDVVVLSLPWSQVELAMKKLRTLSHHAIEVLVLPQAGTSLQMVRRLRRLGRQTLLQVAEPPLTEWDRAAKRTEDVIIASLALFFLLPLLAVTALAIKLDSRGPVLFKQKRAGFNGALIEVWKFRSMYVEGTDLHASRQTSQGDPRVTRLGRLIRRTSLDELPQLWNVLQGQMSLVGPRPHALATSAEGQSLDMIVEEYAARHRVKPGITGWAQVNGARGELTSREQVRRRVNYDLYYIENWSVFFDLKIMLITAVRVLCDPNAY